MNENEQENEKRETLADIFSEYRKDLDEMVAHRQCAPSIRYVARLLDRIETAAKRERERDECLLFRLLRFDIEDYQSDLACNAYRQTVKDCCARLEIPYDGSGKVIAEEMDKSKLGVEVEREGVL